MPSRYQIEKLIGKGSYGSVNEAFDKEKQVSVAIKQLKNLFDDLIDCKRILRELAILTRLNSRSVVRVHDIVIPPRQDFDELYIVLEMCDSDLKKLVRTDVFLTVPMVNTLLYNLLVGLKYIHSAGIYHRDLKPANVLVNQNCDVKICDFGLARAIGGEALGDPLLLNTPRDGEEETEEQRPPGAPVVPSTLRKKRVMTQHVVTRWYRAPELILLQHGYTEAIDIWSVGCIYAELLQTLDMSLRLQDRGPLFPGGSCFPLSPANRKAGKKGARTRGANDQLEMIFNVLGTPSERELQTLENEDAKQYVRSFDPRPGEGIRNRFKGVDPNMLDILNKMLQFCPRDRIRVQHALEHRALADYRDASLEVTAPGMVTLTFEKEGELGETQLRRLFMEEMRKFKASER